MTICPSMATKENQKRPKELEERPRSLLRTVSFAPVALPVAF